MIVVSGSASGMGEATLARLRKEGFEVIGIDRHSADVVADLAEPRGRSEAVRSITATCRGALSGAAAFAGVSGFGRPGDEVVSTNFFGAVDLLVGLRPLLAARGAASALAVSSNAATTTPIDVSLVDACLRLDEAAARALALEAGGPAAYAASKLALARWVRRVATTDEWIGCGVSLNAIAPGLVETPMSAEMRADPLAQGVIDRIPLPIGRAGTVEEVASLAHYLLGPEGRFAVGSVMVVDGGTEARLRPDDWPSPPVRQSRRQL